MRELLLAAAQRRGIKLRVAEWPGGELEELSVYTMKLSPAGFTKIVSGAPRIYIDERLALGVFAALPWGSFI